MISVRNLVKAYPGTLALNDVSFNVEKGEIVGFLGPNGAGKSTTMRILTCFIPPTSGAVSVAGFDVLKQSMEVRRRVGYLPENNPLYTEMRVEEYLDFRATLWKVPRRQRVTAIADALDKCGLVDVKKRIVGQLSKGFRQRVGLADAIVHDPEIVILDEPTIGLDPNQVRTVREVIRDFGKNRTVMLSTHILSEVEKMCGRVLIINRGHMVADGSPAEIINRLTTTGRIRLDLRAAGKDVKDVLERVPGVRSVVAGSHGDLQTYMIDSRDGKDPRPEIFRAAVQNSWEVVELTLERVSLEDAFVELTVSGKPVPNALGAPTPAGVPK